MEYQNEENNDNQSELSYSSTETQPTSVEQDEARQLAKEIGELRQEAYTESEIDEESVYEVI